jgi:hypothetical protein
MGRRPLPTAGGEARRLIRMAQEEAVKKERLRLHTSSLVITTKQTAK